MISLPQVIHVFLGAPLVCLDWEVVQFETLRPLFWDGRPGGHRLTWLEGHGMTWVEAIAGQDPLDSSISRLGTWSP